MVLKHLAQDVVVFRKMYAFSESAVLRSQGQPAHRNKEQAG